MTTPPFNLDHLPGTAWPDVLRPLGENTLDKESIASWWQRNRRALAHLPEDLCEQWIYRHWTHSPFDFFPLDSLIWEHQSWSGETLLKSIYRAGGGELKPQFDYDTFQRRGGDDRHATARALDSGTWDYPMILLATPYGVIDRGEVRPDVRLVIVEGHQRHRYLNALHALGRSPSGLHEVIVISTPLTRAPQQPVQKGAA